MQLAGRHHLVVVLVAVADDLGRPDLARQLAQRVRGRNADQLLHPAVEHQIAPLRVAQMRRHRGEVHEGVEPRLALAQRRLGLAQFGDVDGGRQHRLAPAVGDPGGRDQPLHPPPAGQHQVGLDGAGRAALGQLALQRLALLGLLPDLKQGVDAVLGPQPEVPPRPRVDVEGHAGVDLADHQPDRDALGDGAELRLALGHRPLGGAALAQVAQVGQEDRGAAALALDHDDLDREQRAVGPHRVDLDPAAEDRRGAAGEAARHPAQMRLAQVRRHDQLDHRPADRLLAGKAEGPLGGGVELHDQAVRVDADVAVERRLQRRHPQPLRLLARGLGRLAVGDLAADALDLQEPAIGIEDPGVGPLLPVPQAVGVLGAELDRVAGRFRRDLSDVRLEGGQVLWDDEVRVAVAARPHLGERHADVALGRLVHEGPLALGVDPQDELGLRVNHRAIARLAGRQRPGLGPRLGDVALHRHVVGGAAALLAQRRDGGLLLDQVAVAVAVDDRSLPGPPGLELAPHLGEELRRLHSARQHVLGLAAQNFLLAVAGRGLEGVVDEGEAVVGAGDLHRIAGLLDRQRQQPQLGRPAALLGDVGGEQHPAAVGGPVLADPHPAPIGDPVHMLAAFAGPEPQPPLDEIRAHVGVVDRAAGHALAQPVLEALADRQHLAQRLGHAGGVAAVVEDDAVVPVADHQPVGQRLRRRPEPRLGGGEPPARPAGDPRREPGRQRRGNRDQPVRRRLRQLVAPGVNAEGDDQRDQPSGGNPDRAAPQIGGRTRRLVAHGAHSHAAGGPQPTGGSR